MPKKKRKLVKNGVAKDLRMPKYKMQVQKDKRKSKKQLQRELQETMKIIFDSHVSINKASWEGYQIQQRLTAMDDK